MKYRFRRALALLTVCALALCAAPQQARALTSTGFADVSDEDDGELAQAILLMQNYTPGIVNGTRDSDGVKRFHPDEAVTRGELLKMAMTAAETYTADHSRDDLHWAGKYYTIAMENDILISDHYTDTGATGLEGEGITLMFPCTAEALEAPASRYEAAAVFANTCSRILREPDAIALKAYANVSDYDLVPVEFVAAVEQAVGKGLLQLDGESAFRGSGPLLRRDAVMAVYCMLWSGKRTPPAWSRVPDDALMLRSKRPEGFVSLAEWLQNGHMDSHYNIDAEARERLFGDPDKYYFVSVREAEPFATTVTLPVWGRDRSGSKYETSVTIVVHKLVAEEIQLIFNQIFEDPERYPMANCVGGARFSGERGRHAWGCAIDINATYNCECNFRSGEFTPTCGYGWYPIVDDPDSFRWCGRPLSAYAGTLAPSEMSLKPDGSVVTAFADYGWGWGGSGSNIVGEGDGWGAGSAFDFMHFSVRPDGG